MAVAETKRCSRCKQIKAGSEFPPDRRSPSGLQPSCRECCRAAAKLWYSRHRERVCADAREKYRANPEIFRERNRAYSRKNSAKNTARAVAWIKANPERFRDNMKAVEGRRRAAMEGGATGPQTRAWLLKQPRSCHWCGVKCAPVIDHLIPLARGGKHELGNLVVSCRSCNARKSARDPIEFAQSIGKLL